MNKFQALRLFSSDMPERATVPIDLVVVCLWSALGLVLTALALTLGFGVEIGQMVAMAG
jgi:hypothetical protein